MLKIVVMWMKIVNVKIKFMCSFAKIFAMWELREFEENSSINIIRLLGLFFANLTVRVFVLVNVIFFCLPVVENFFLL